MKKFISIVFASILLAGCASTPLFNQNVENIDQPDSITPPDSIYFNLDLNNDKSAESVIILKKYSSISSINNALDSIYRMAYSPVYFESHLGVCQSLPISYSTGYTYPTFGFKLNLTRPKMLYSPNDVLMRINTLNEYMNKVQYIPTIETQKELANIKRQMEEYQNYFWYSRLSIGIMFPYYLQIFSWDNDLQRQRLDLPDDADGYKNTWFSFTNSYIFIGYDIGDIATIDAGIDISNFNTFFIGLSFDFSTTPSREMAGFISSLKSFMGLGF